MLNAPIVILTFDTAGRFAVYNLVMCGFKAETFNLGSIRLGSDGPLPSLGTIGT